MDGFSGYVTTVTKKDGNGLVSVENFLLKRYADPSEAPPRSIVAAAETFNRLDQDTANAFAKGEMVINVVDATKGKVETYDVTRLATEMVNEILDFLDFPNGKRAPA